MTTLQHVNRILRSRATRTGEKRGTDLYHSAADGAKPQWWSDRIEAELPSGDFIGVLEQSPGDRRGAIVFYEDGMLVLDDPPRYIDFDDIRSVTAPLKAPPPTGLVVRDWHGKAAWLPFEPPSLVFTLFMLMSSIADERRRTSANVE
ncbi:hypothetical protein ACNOYE_01795 [Nannocystaceae bacterium ST9]